MSGTLTIFRRELRSYFATPVAYVFNASRPNGWVRATPAPNGMTLELRALDANHPEHAKQTPLSWRV